jgi:hypothetical protein
MNRREVMRGAILRFTRNARDAGVDRVYLDVGDEMTADQLARFIEDHLAPESEPERRPSVVITVDAGRVEIRS